MTRFYQASTKKFQNLYRVWFRIEGELNFQDLTEENEERAIEKFAAYFPQGIVKEVQLCREHVRCY